MKLKRMVERHILGKATGKIVTEGHALYRFLRYIRIITDKVVFFFREIDADGRIYKWLISGKKDERSNGHKTVLKKRI